jgi:hypothetical protein
MVCQKYGREPVAYQDRRPPPNNFMESLKDLFFESASSELDGSSSMTISASRKNARASAIFCHSPVLNSLPPAKYWPRMVL